MLDRIEQGKVGVWRMEYPVEEPRLVDLREEDGRPNCSTASPLPGPRSCTLSKLCTPSTGVGRASRVRGHVPAEWGRLRLRRGELEPECDSSNRPDMSGGQQNASRGNRYRKKLSPLCSPLDVGFRALKEAIRRRDAKECRGSLGFNAASSPFCSSGGIHGGRFIVSFALRVNCRGLDHDRAIRIPRDIAEQKLQLAWAAAMMVDGGVMQCDAQC